MTKKSNSQPMAADAETACVDIYFKTLRKIAEQLDEGKLSANMLTAVSKFLADQGIDLDMIKGLSSDPGQALADEVEELGLDQYAVEGSHERFPDMGD